MTRCQHTGSSCIHRRFEPQAYRTGPEQASWGDVIEIVVGTVIFLTLFLGLPLLLFLAASPQ